MKWFSEIIEPRIASGELPTGWEVVKSECIGGTPGHWTHVSITGAVYPAITRGKRKGRPNYRKPVHGTGRTIVVDAPTGKGNAHDAIG